MSRAHVRVPSALLYAPIPEGAKMLWALLDDLCREYAAVHLSVPAAATTLRCSLRAVQKWRTALVEAGWLQYDPARGRGEASLWVPLHRARPVIHRTAVPVDNSTGRANGRANGGSPIDLGKGERGFGLDGGGTRARTEEQKRAGRVVVLPLTEALHSHAPASPCSLCAGSRWVDSLAFPDRVERCPACQPHAQGPF